MIRLYWGGRLLGIRFLIRSVIPDVMVNCLPAEYRTFVYDSAFYKTFYLFCFVFTNRKLHQPSIFPVLSVPLL